MQDDTPGEIRPYLIAFALLGVITMVAAVLSQGLLGIAGERLTCRMREVWLHIDGRAFMMT